MDTVTLVRSMTLIALKQALGFAYMLTPPSGNIKIEKSLKKSVYTGILHLSPEKKSRNTAVKHSFATTNGAVDSGHGRNTCPWAGSCRKLCLDTAGHGGIGLDGNGLNGCQTARIKRTRALLHKNFFVRCMAWEMLTRDIKRMIKAAKKKDMVSAFRLNGTSDLLWEKMINPMTGLTLMEQFSGQQFYDYTKASIIKLRNNLPANYHLTFSRQAETDAEAVAHLAAGYNVSACFETLPATWKGFEVVDGDEYDSRMMDKSTDSRGLVIGLLPKGKAKTDASGFVIR